MSHYLHQRTRWRNTLQAPNIAGILLQTGEVLQYFADERYCSYALDMIKKWPGMSERSELNGACGNWALFYQTIFIAMTHSIGLASLELKHGSA